MANFSFLDVSTPILTQPPLANAININRDRTFVLDSEATSNKEGRLWKIDAERDPKISRYFPVFSYSGWKM
jgi:hypothetical protein